MARPVTFGSTLPHVNVSPRLAAAIQREAAVRGETVSDVVRRALARYFDGEPGAES
jgi:hypothetical protein